MSLNKSLPAPETGAVLAKAVLNAADMLGLSRKALAKVIGVSEASLSRLARGRRVDPESKEGELALLFVRLFRSLDALFGGSSEQCRAFMHASHTYLGGVPADLVLSPSGLVHVVDYLDAMRGKI